MQTYFKYMDYLDPSSFYYKRYTPEDFKIFEVHNLKEGWSVNLGDESWTMYSIIGKELPIQGFKIHVSSVYDEAQDVLNVVSDILIKEGVFFKHINNSKTLFNMYSKHGNRSSAGKFITIYPNNDEQFLLLLDILYSSLKNFKEGPYIFTDKQFKNSNVYYRYGAFKNIKNDEGHYCIVDPLGNLIQDERGNKFKLPSFIKLPDKLQSLENAKESPVEHESPLKKYKIEKAIRYSNAGGIYSAVRIADGMPCIIKEARSQIGLDRDYVTSLSRLNNEYESLKLLSDVDGVIKVIDYFKVWKHTFLVEERADGVSLHTWLARNYPFSIEEDSKAYFEKVVIIIEKLKNTVENMHKKGVYMCDLQTQNIIIDENLNIKIIDFEVAERSSEDTKIRMATKGFSHPLNTIPKDRDWYSINRILHMCLMPTGSVYDLDMKINTSQCFWIFKNFGIDIFNYYYDFQIEVGNNISNFNNIFMNTYDESRKIIDGNLKNIDNTDVFKVLDMMKNALITNIDTESDIFINGDIRQFEMDCGKFNIQNGSFGAILALNRTNMLDDSIKSWISKQVPKLLQTEYNNGFFSGRAGIASVLYECGYVDESIELMNIISSSLNLKTKDVSFRSGLSGIGISFATFYNETGDVSFLIHAKKIRDSILNILESEEKINGTDWDSVDVGLMDGYSGISLFFSVMYSVTSEQKYIDYSKAFLDKDLLRKFKHNDGSLQLLDKNNRALPYLSNGSIGLGIAIDFLNNASGIYHYADVLEEVKKIKNTKITIDASLFDGVLGFLMLTSIYKDVSVEDMISIASIYFLQKEEAIYIPGKMFYKLSSDLHTGVTGAILALICAIERDSTLWIPMVGRSLISISEKKIA